MARVTPAGGRLHRARTARSESQTHSDSQLSSESDVALALPRIMIRVPGRISKLGCLSRTVTVTEFDTWHWLHHGTGPGPIIIG